MTKNKNTLVILQEFLEKARRRLHDEELEPWERIELEEDGYDENSFDLMDDDYEDDEAAAWLRENDPSIASAEEEDYDEESEEPQEEREVVPELSPSPAPAPARRRMVEDATPPPNRRVVDSAIDPRHEDALQPTREELLEMREYTRPWHAQARDRAHLSAEAHVNPIKHHQGRIIEARNLSAADRQRAYEEFISSPEYQNADPVTQWDMDAKFHEDWANKNANYFHDVIRAHADAHKKGLVARELFERNKDEKIRHIAGGGRQSDENIASLEEGIQHAGGSREDEDSAPTGITYDKSAQFAAGNEEFVRDYLEGYEKRKKRFSSDVDLDSFNDENRADIGTVLGNHAVLSDPAKKKKVDNFIQRYHPMIVKAARRVLGKLGLSGDGDAALARGGAVTGENSVDVGLLYEAGMHALFQAINDYDHDHVKQAKFTTHFNRKMDGLMRTALKTLQEDIPEDMKIKAKKFNQQRAATNASPVKVFDAQGNLKHILNPDGTPYVPKPETPAAPEPVSTPEPPAPPKPVAAPAPVIRRRKVHDIIGGHPPEVQDRFKRLSSIRMPKMPKPGDNDEDY